VRQLDSLRVPASLVASGLETSLQLLNLIFGAHPLGLDPWV